MMNQKINKGPVLLEEINAIRKALHAPTLVGIQLRDSNPTDPSRCALARAINCTVARGTAPIWRRKFTLRTPTRMGAEAAGQALGQPVNLETREVRLSPTMFTFMMAFDYGLVFADENGMLKGWIDPTDDDPSAWNLHLMPGLSYPPGHAPVSTPTAVSAPARELSRPARARREPRRLGTASSVPRSAVSTHSVGSNLSAGRRRTRQ